MKLIEEWHAVNNAYHCKTSLLIRLNKIFLCNPFLAKFSEAEHEMVEIVRFPHVHVINEEPCMVICTVQGNLRDIMKTKYI